MSSPGNGRQTIQNRLPWSPAISHNLTVIVSKIIMLLVLSRTVCPSSAIYEILHAPFVSPLKWVTFASCNCNWRRLAKRWHKPTWHSSMVFGQHTDRGTLITLKPHMWGNHIEPISYRTRPVKWSRFCPPGRTLVHISAGLRLEGIWPVRHSPIATDSLTA